MQHFLTRERDGHLRCEGASRRNLNTGRDLELVHEATTLRFLTMRTVSYTLALTRMNRWQFLLQSQPQSSALPHCDLPLAFGGAYLRFSSAKSAQMSYLIWRRWKATNRML